MQLIVITKYSCVYDKVAFVFLGISCFFSYEKFPQPSGLSKKRLSMNRSDNYWPILNLFSRMLDRQTTFKGWDHAKL